MKEDEAQLRLLSIFHYVVGGLAGVFALLPVVHLLIGLFFILAPEKFDGQGGPPPPFVGWLFVGMASIFILIGMLLATLLVVTGRFLAKRRHYMFCLVIAGVECIFVPFGTVLGVFTIIVLTRESVKELFAVRPAL